MEAFHVWFLDTVHPALKEALKTAGMTCHDATRLTRQELVHQAKNTPPVDALVLRSRIRLDREVLDALPDLKWIARSGSGLENIDLDRAAKLGIAVHSSPEGNQDAVGEHVLGMLLSVLNKMRSGDASIRARRWEREAHRGRELKSLTVGIMGYGHMGSAVAERLAGFGCRVIAYDKYKEGWGESPFAAPPLPHVHPVGWGAFCREADVVTLHLPWTEETKGLVDDAWLNGFEKPVILLNTARGPIVQTTALLRALDDGRVTDACLDVLEFEGRSLEGLDGLSDPDAREAFERLLAHPRVLLSPHVAGWTVESYVKLSTVLADKILGA
ncbi:MAG: NAD(P)-dependent oxidoreductase [Bacteroidetes bacterium]|nr:NAD(P)-dependent oxidoreductase [Bacteroidota bacterium]